MSIWDHAMFSLFTPEEAVMGRQIWSTKNKCAWSKGGLLFSARNCWLKIFCCKNISHYETDSVRNVIKGVVGALVARHLFSEPILLLTAARCGFRGSHNATFSSQRRWLRLRTSHCKKSPEPYRDLTICNLIAQLESKKHSTVWRSRWGFSSQILFPVRCPILSSLKVTEIFLFSSTGCCIRL